MLVPVGRGVGCVGCVGCVGVVTGMRPVAQPSPGDKQRKSHAQFLRINLTLLN